MNSRITCEAVDWLGSVYLDWRFDHCRDMVAIIPVDVPHVGPRICRRKIGLLADVSAGPVGHEFPTVAGQRFTLTPSTDPVEGRMLVFSVHQHDAGYEPPNPMPLPKLPKTVAMYVAQCLDTHAPINTWAARDIGAKYGLSAGEVAQEIEEARTDWAATQPQGVKHGRG
jgi:hypothetical protein